MNYDYEAAHKRIEDLHAQSDVELDGMKRENNEMNNIGKRLLKTVALSLVLILIGAVVWKPLVVGGFCGWVAGVVWHAREFWNCEQRFKAHDKRVFEILDESRKILNENSKALLIDYAHNQQNYGQWGN